VSVEGEDRWDLTGCSHCKDGIISLQGCQGVPVLMSTPHFLDGDETLVDAIDGIQPVRESHQTFLHVEPLSGLIFLFLSQSKSNTSPSQSPIQWDFAYLFCFLQKSHLTNKIIESNFSEIQIILFRISTKSSLTVFL